MNFFLFLFFSLGIIFGFHFVSFLAFFLLSSIFLFLIYFFYKKRRFFLSDIFILLLFLSLGGVWSISFSFNKADKFLNREGHFKLEVISLPQSKDLKNTFFAQIKEFHNIPWKSKAKVMDYSRKMNYLHTYEGRGKLSKRVSGRWNSYCLWVKKDALLKELPQEVGKRFVTKTTDYFLTLFKINLSPQGYRFLSSVFLGRREVLKEETEIFLKAGVSHLLAISGLHIGLTSLILFFLLKFFNIKFRPRLFISVIFLYLYTFLTGARPSTVRALIMYSVFALSFFAKRKTNLLNSLGLAGLISLIIDPLSLFDVGFQLSYLAVFALIWGFKIFPPKPAFCLVLNYSKDFFFASFFVTLFTTPLVSYYFGKVYLLSIFYNVILIPFFTVILAVNFLFLIFSPLKFFVQSLGRVLTLLIFWFINLTRLLGSFKFSFISYTFSPPAIFFYYSFLVAIIILFVRKSGGKLGHPASGKG